MATIKSFTDLQQSRKLAEILPLESADMHYNNGSCRGVDYTEHFSAELMPYQEALHLMKIHKTNFMFQVIPCWSLTALLAILTKQDFIIKTIGNEFNIDIPIRHCKIWFSSLLDAAFEMICWLKENNKL